MLHAERHRPHPWQCGGTVYTGLHREAATNTLVPGRFAAPYSSRFPAGQPRFHNLNLSTVATATCRSRRCTRTRLSSASGHGTPRLPRLVSLAKLAAVLHHCRRSAGFCTPKFPKDSLPTQARLAMLEQLVRWYIRGSGELWMNSAAE